MNNEPVAWMVGGKLCKLLENAELQSQFHGHSVVSLYAHPKDLTDQEIDSLIADVAEKPTDEDLYDFAKAILRKAQEK